MTDPNCCTFVGRFACDAIRVREGFAIAHIIVNRDVGGREKPSRFTFFLNDYDRLVPHLRRGRLAYVESEATVTEEYVDRKGVTHPASVAFIVRRLSLLDSPSAGSPQGGGNGREV